MYGFWILTIIFGCLCVACFVISYLIENFGERYEPQLKYESNSRRITFVGDDYDKNHLSDKEFARLTKILKKRSVWHKLYMGDWEQNFTIIAWVCTAITIIMLLCAIFVPFEARNEAIYWEEFKPMAEQVIANSNSYQSISITEKVIEYNSWLAKARASQKVWGIWSVYYYIDLSEFEYISIGGN